MAVIGLFLFVKDWRTFKVPQRYIKLILQFFSAVFSLLIIAVFSSLINNNFDPYFYKFPIVLIISFASSYCYIKWLAAISKKELTTELLIKYFVGATLLQCFLSLLVFLIPAFRNFIFTIVPMTEMNEEAVYFNIHPQEDVLFRMIPVGYDFWGIGTTLTIIIFLMAILANQEKSRRDFIYILLSLVFIVVIGASISRTTLVGALFFLLYLLFCKGERRNKKYLLRMIIVFIPIVVIAYTLFLESYPIFDIVFERAFSVFYSFKETGEMQSVESMVGKAVIPTEFRTWIIGDGLMADPLYPGTKFYKGVDIGYWRMIFGIGVLGLFVFSFIQYMFCKLAGFRKWEMLFLLLIYCAFMYKGIFYYDLLMSPFIMMILYNSRIKRKKTIYQMDNTPKQPLLSIIIPVYNLKEYIPICLESIYSQGIRNDLFEVVIVDDGSKDDSWNVINHYTQIYDNIKAIRQVNAGVSAARNRGVEECSFDYLTFLDADDEFHPKSLNSIFSLMEKYKDADVFYFQSFLKSSDGKYKRVNDWDGRYKENVKYSSKALLYKNSFLNGGCVWGCVYSHSFFINNRLTFAEGIVNNEDSIFNYRLLSKSPVVRFASIPFYLVTEREGSASRSDSIERVIGYAKNMEYAFKMHSEGVDKFEKQVADACLYNTISAATNMFLNIGERDWKKLFDILSIASLHKLYVPWFPLNQKLKILLINISFRLYFSILVRKISTNK